MQRGHAERGSSVQSKREVVNCEKKTYVEGDYGRGKSGGGKKRGASCIGSVGNSIGMGVSGNGIGEKNTSAKVGVGGNWR